MTPQSSALALSIAELGVLNRRFETEPAGAIVRWALEAFGTDRVCLTFSAQDTVLVDIAVRVEPGIEVVFIDTGYHFPETLETVEAARRRYGLNLRIMRVPQADPPLWQEDPLNCCSAAKLSQLDAALEDKLAWLSGLRRVEAPTRSEAPIVGLDHRGLVKVNPLATWSDVDVKGYVADHDLVINPLIERGYHSIGCAPCTHPVGPDDSPRAGRWAGTDKTECGLHTELPGPNGSA